MPIKLKLDEETRELEIDVDPKEWEKAFQRALDNGEMVRIRNSKGEVLGINPKRVLYWVEVPESDSQLTLEPEATLA